MSKTHSMTATITTEQAITTGKLAQTLRAQTPKIVKKDKEGKK